MRRTLVSLEVMSMQQNSAFMLLEIMRCEKVVALWLPSPSFVVSFHIECILRSLPNGSYSLQFTNVWEWTLVIGGLEATLAMILSKSFVWLGYS